MIRVTLPERPDWRKTAEALGFGFHEMYGEPYWVDGAAFLLTLEEVEQRIEDPSGELHAMCMDLVAEVTRSEALMARLDIPSEHHDLVARSWAEGDRHLYGRFDLAYDGTGPATMLEYNADTPTSVFEAAFFQHHWLTDRVGDGWLPPGADQFNLVQESLVEAFAAFDRGPIFHFACVLANEEDKGTTTYLMDCALQAGHRTSLLDMSEIGVDAQGRFTDRESRVVERCFKLYPWEDMLREPFAEHLRPGVFVEPAWKAILSNKGMLPLLWERHEGHPNLLPAFFADDPRAGDLEHAVSKPFHSREGENIALIEGGHAVEETGGDYAASPRIVQAYAPLHETASEDGLGHAVIGSWIVGDRPCGMGLREDRGRITRDLSRFVPHAIVDDPAATAEALLARARGD